MAETLGSLCDKLTIVELKQWHSEDPDRLASLDAQESRLQAEIDELAVAAIAGDIPLSRLSFASNKVYKKEGNVVPDIGGTVGEIFAKLAEVNCRLWHEQEKVYEFEQVPPDRKDEVVKNLAVFNLERTRCIDEIDNRFRSLLEASTE